MSRILAGVGPGQPIETTERGGKHSAIPYRFDLVPPLALMDIAQVLHEGAAKYGVDNWRGIDIDAHLNHLQMHVVAYQAGDATDEHLSHAATRAMFALELSHAAK